MPNGLFVDQDKSLYIADRWNNRIRVVDGVSGVVRTIAGNGTNGYSGDGGAATDASLNSPTDLVKNDSGDLFILDMHNQRVRRVGASTNIITTFAGDGTRGYFGDGGPATNASFFFPQGLALGPGGDLYVADRLNHRIRKISAETGIVTTVAGDGIEGFSGDGGIATVAKISRPADVFVDILGNIYIASEGNNRVRKVGSSGIISTIAGNGIFGFSGDGGSATHARIGSPARVTVDAENNLFLAEKGNNRIRRIDRRTGVITTVVGNGGKAFSGDGGKAIHAGLDEPNGIFVDEEGDLYIATGNRVRVVRGIAASGSAMQNSITPALDSVLVDSQSTIDVAFLVQNAAPASHIQLDLRYDPELLSFSNLTPGSSGGIAFDVLVSRPENGILSLDLSPSGPLPVGVTEFVTVAFDLGEVAFYSTSISVGRSSTLTLISGETDDLKTGSTSVIQRIPAPQDLKAEVFTDPRLRVDLSWVASKRFQSFVVFRAAVGENSLQRLSAVLDTSAFIDSTVTPMRHYSYRVHISLDDFLGPASVVDIQIPAVPPKIVGRIPDFRGAVNTQIVVDLNDYENDLADEDGNLVWSTEGVSFSEISGIQGSGGSQDILIFRPADGFVGTSTVTIVLRNGSGSEDRQEIRLVWVSLEEFNGDGQVGFSDFVLFAQNYGKRQQDDDFQDQFDLNNDGEVNFPDFVLFAQAYGK